MKAERVEPDFTPVSLTFTFESINEVRDMWHRLNASESDVYRFEKEGDVAYIPKEEWTGLNAEAFDVVNRLLHDLGGE